MNQEHFGFFKKTSKQLTAGAVVVCIMGGLQLLCAGLSRAHADQKEKIITVTDCIGRQVAIPAEVDRIACLYAFAGHVVTMFGRGRDIVAVSNGLHRDVLLARICPSIRSAIVPKAQGGGINIEELLTCRPDIVFVSGEIGRNEAEAQKLNAFNIPFLVVEFHSVKQQQEAIDIIGTAINAADKAARYNRYYGDCIARVQDAVQTIPDQQRVRAYYATVEATRTPGSNTLTADWMSRTGIINVAHKQQQSMFDSQHRSSLEQILLWNPDVILVNEPGVAGTIRHNPQWATLKAVQQNKVFQMPVGISRWGHPGSLETPLAMLWTTQTLYPDRFAALDMPGETKRYYKEFFNLKLTDKLVSQILAGKGMRLPKKGKKMSR